MDNLIVKNKAKFWTPCSRDVRDRVQGGTFPILRLDGDYYIIKVDEDEICLDYRDVDGFRLG